MLLHETAISFLHVTSYGELDKTLIALSLSLSLSMTMQQTPHASVPRHAYRRMVRFRYYQLRWKENPPNYSIILCMNFMIQTSVKFIVHFITSFVLLYCHIIINWSIDKDIS